MKEGRLGSTASRSRASPKRHQQRNVHQFITASDGQPTLYLHFRTDCRPSLSPPLSGMRAQSTHVCLRRKLKPFCSPDDVPSCAHHQQNQTCHARQKIHHPTFRKADILFTGRLTPISGSLEDETDVPRYTSWPRHLHDASIHEHPTCTASTATGGDTSEVTKLAVLLGPRRDIFLCPRTEPFYSSTRSSNLTDLSKTLRDQFLRDPLEDLCWWELGFGWSFLAVAHLTRTPGPAPAPHHSPTGKARLVQPTTTQREIR